MTAPACPLCGRDLVPSPRLEGYLECPDRTCSGLLRDSEGRPAWDDLLGASTQELMRAPVTPQGGGHGGGGGCRHKRQALKAVTAYRRERRYLDQDAPPPGLVDRAPAEARKPVLARVPLPLAAWLEQAATRAGLSQSAIIEAALQAVADAAWCADCNLPGLPEAACVGRCPR